MSTGLLGSSGKTFSDKWYDAWAKLTGYRDYTLAPRYKVPIPIREYDPFVLPKVGTDIPKGVLTPDKFSKAVDKAMTGLEDIYSGKGYTPVFSYEIAGRGLLSGFISSSSRKKTGLMSHKLLESESYLKKPSSKYYTDTIDYSYKIPFIEEKYIKPSERTKEYPKPSKETYRYPSPTEYYPPAKPSYYTPKPPDYNYPPPPPDYDYDIHINEYYPPPPPPDYKFYIYERPPPPPPPDYNPPPPREYPFFSIDLPKPKPIILDDELLKPRKRKQRSLGINYEGIAGLREEKIYDPFNIKINGKKIDFMKGGL
jgi:hypothetical protein